MVGLLSGGYTRSNGKGRFMKIDTSTRLYAVLGDPVAHSLSPVMHNSAFEERGINGIYVALRVTDPKAVLDAVRTLGLAGCSVTIPHKEAVLENLDEVTPFAAKVGAVNTIINRDGHLVGDNTDGPAALAALQSQIEVTGKKVALIGAGGAAKGIGHALCDAGGKVTVINRSMENGKRLANELSVAFLPLPEIDKEAFDILINTTSVGMHPKVDESPVEGYTFKEHQIVMDIIYNPLETKLMATARQKKCLLIDGVEMFVRQGAMQFELWTGGKAPYQKMDSVVRQELMS
jgi:shikimate dehydrogenase